MLESGHRRETRHLRVRSGDVGERTLLLILRSPPRQDDVSRSSTPCSSDIRACSDWKKHTHPSCGVKLRGGEDLERGEGKQHQQRVVGAGWDRRQWSSFIPIHQILASVQRAPFVEQTPELPRFSSPQEYRTIASP